MMRPGNSMRRRCAAGSVRTVRIARMRCVLLGTNTPPSGSRCAVSVPAFAAKPSRAVVSPFAPCDASA